MRRVCQSVGADAVFVVQEVVDLAVMCSWSEWWRGGEESEEEGRRRRCGGKR